MSEHPMGMLPPTNEPLRVAVRRMRWFRSAFQTYVTGLGQKIGCDYDIDETRLADIFVRWLRAIEIQRPSDRSERRAFFEFAAGLMLRELIADMPLKAKRPPNRIGADSAGAFWPEGYACTLFCLSVHSAAMKQEYNTTPQLTKDIDDLRHWWSFRENTQENAGFSVGFLQMVMGHQPNWTFPDAFRSRLEAEIASG